MGVRFLEFSANILKDAYGNPAGVVGLARNIADRKKAETTLRQSETKFRHFFEKSPDYCYIISPEGTILEVNKSGLEALGYNKKELLGKPLLSTVYAPYSRKKAKQLFEMWKSTGKIQNEELDIITKRGEKRTVLLSVHSVEDIAGRLLHSVSVQRDITEHKKADETLKKSEEKYRSIVELSPDGIVTANIKGVVTSVNKAFLDLTGFSEDEIVGKHFTKLGTLRIKGIPKYTKLLGSILRGKKLDITEFVYLRKDGTQRLAEAHISLLEEKGKKVGFQAILRDITDRKQMEWELKKSEEKYRKQFEGALDAIFLADVETGILVDCNRAATKLVGRKKSELVGEHQRILHPPEESVGEFSRTFKQHLKEKEGDVLEAQIITKDGKIRDVAIKANIFELGNKLILQGIFRDVTERKKTEDELKESEEKFRNLAEQSPNMIFINQEGRILYANRECEELMGYTKEEFYSPDFNFLTLISPETMESIKSSFSKHLKEEEVPPYEYSLITKEGKQIEAILTTKLITYQGRKAILGTVTNITEHKKAEETLRKERETLERVTGNLNVVLTMISKDHRILWANKFLKDFLGDVNGKMCYSTLNRLDHIYPGCRVKEVFETGKQAIHEQPVVSPDGQDVWLEITAIPIRDKNGNVAEVLEMAINITERKQAEEKMDEMMKDLVMINEKLGVVGKLTRHDARNKLSVIANNIYLAKRQLAGNHAALEYLDALESAVEQMEKIFEFARIYEMLGAEELSYVDVEKNVKEAAMLFSDLAGGKLVNECDGLTLLADSLLRQIFGNVLI